MEEILKLREKHLKTPATRLKELLQTRREAMERLRSKNSQEDAENDLKIKELEEQLTSLRASLGAKNEIKEQKRHELSSLTESLKEEKEEKLRVTSDVSRIRQRTELLQKKKPSKRDEDLLVLGNEKFKLYKKLTGIHWNFEAIEKDSQDIQGYVTNFDDKIHHFVYKNKPAKELNDLLWEEIRNSA